MRQNRIVIGLTGNIGSGKSTVSKHLIKRGFYVIDADIVAREVVAVGTEGLKRIEEVFGSKFIQPDRSLDRKKLGEWVFGNRKELEKLNQVLHPIIRRRLIRSIEMTEEKVIFIDAALIYESGMDQLLDMVWFVCVKSETEITRLMLRDDLTRDEALKRIESQKPQGDKRARADHVIDNDGTKKQLYEKIDSLIFYLGLDNA